MATTILRLSDVVSRTGLARSTIYLRIKKGEFPKPIHLGDRAVGWLETEIDEWLEDRIILSRKTHLDERANVKGGFTNDV
jgi:prophage regulatory protein